MDMGVTEALALAAMAAGTAISYDASETARKEQQAALTAKMLRDKEYQDKNSQLVNENAQQYNPQTRQQNEQAATDAAAGSLTGALLESRESAAPADISGKVSSDYISGNAKTAASELQRSTDIARLWAKMRGPTDLRANEGMNNASYADRSRSLSADRGFMAQAGDRNAMLAGQPDGLQMLAGNALMQFGTGSLAGNLAKGAGTGAGAAGKSFIAPPVLA